MVDDLAFGEEATAFDAAMADNAQIGGPYVNLASGSRKRGSQIFDVADNP